MFWSCLRHAMPIMLLVLWSTVNSLVTSFFTNESDRLALLAIKDQLTDPLGALSSWNDSLHFCEWHGVRCSHHHPHRVIRMNLKNKKLEGMLSPHIGNLSFLTAIWLTENKFHGPIPQEIGRLFQLEVLSLDSNSFDGKIPANITHCSHLRQINLTDNNLSGGIPFQLSFLSKLTALDLSKNELIKGSMPSSLGNLSSLTLLNLGECSLRGSIPNTLCRISTLKLLNLYANNLTGTFPSCLYNHSQIRTLGLTENHLEGKLPYDIGLTIPNLQGLYMSSNNFTGPIPSSLFNASKLEIIDLALNQFTGQVPRDLGRLQGLRKLNLHSNLLGSSIDHDLKFITSLINCSNLNMLTISDNFLRGSLPNSIANLSTQITRLQLEVNKIYGSIPTGIENLVNLTFLSFANNFLSGEIPREIGMLSKLHKLDLDGNQFSGEIPNSFYNLTQLEILSLSRNRLHGGIPINLGKCKNLWGMNFSYNRLNGTVSKKVFGFSSLVVLDISNNALTGSLSTEVGDLTDLEELDISNNRLSGRIPDSLGQCLPLEYLYMGGNIFKGKIPQALSSLRGLREFDLSHNKFSGNIPEFLGNFTYLTSLNLSYNELEGPVPKGGVFANATIISVNENRKLCGGVAELHLSPCNRKRTGMLLFLKVIIPVIFSIVGLVLVSCLFYMCYQRSVSKSKLYSPSVSNEKYPRISYHDLLKATNNFSADNLIGIGSSGSVYKGLLAQINTIVAVKVINLQKRGALKNFLSECNALKNIRHRNLLKIITSCWSVDFKGNEFKALILEFMPKGSLEDWLYPKRDKNDEVRHLNFLQRLNIAIGVASALDYLHHDCQPAIVHCDIKPSNVLLDGDMTAHVADFGLAKIFSAPYNSSQSQGSSLAIKGSIGYTAPEYGMGGEVSKQGDVYSYGILLLEIFIGKRPTDDLFQDGRSLHSFATDASSEQVMNIVDSMMLLEGSDENLDIAKNSDRWVRMRECLVSAITLGVTCSVDSPTERLDMGEVVTELYHIKDHYQGVRIHLE